MASDADILKGIKQSLELVREELAGYTVYLFGSRARGTARDRADFDIGVYGKTQLPLDTFYRISDLFEQIPTLHRIDWVDLHETSAQFRDQALQQAKVLLDAEDFGKAYYISPKTRLSFNLFNAEDTAKILREQGVGISNEDIRKIPVGDIDSIE